VIDVRNIMTSIDARQLEKPSRAAGEGQCMGSRWDTGEPSLDTRLHTYIVSGGFARKGAKLLHAMNPFDCPAL
jgi:hypothetical protein